MPNTRTNHETSEIAPKYFVCSRCSYHWKPRKADSIPRNCPSCRSTIWMKPFELKTCARCGYEWGSTSEEPRRCPNCGTYHWSDAPKTYNCLRCNHRWTAKREWSPKRCPKCRSVSWNVEKKDISKFEPVDVRKPVVMDDNIVNKVSEAYKKGESCTAIAVKTSIPFSVVFAIVRGINPNGNIKV